MGALESNQGLSRVKQARRVTVLAESVIDLRASAACARKRD
jgi:hypothetical protein